MVSFLLEDIVMIKFKNRDIVCLNNNKYLVQRGNENIILHPLINDLQRLYIETTSHCNLECTICVRKQWPQTLGGEMSMELFEKLLDEMREFPNLKHIHLGGFGEPLAHSQISDILAKLRNAGYRISISTNGTLLSKEIVQKMINIGVEKIYISIDGINQDAYQKIRSGSNFDQVIQNIYYMRDLKKDMNKLYPKTCIEYVIMRSNIKQVSELPKFAKSLGASNILLSNILAYTEEMYNEVLYENPEGDRSLAPGLIGPPTWNNVDIVDNFPESPVWTYGSDSWLLYGTMSTPRMYWGNSKSCSFINNKAAVVRWDGKVSPCLALLYSYSCYLDHRKKNVNAYHVGDLMQETLTCIWSTADYIEFRNRVKTFDFPSCIDCYIKDKCDYAINNEDCWGGSPSCADCLWAQGIIRCP